jgi:lipoprotein-releasing system permease protein
LQVSKFTNNLSYEETPLPLQTPTYKAAHAGQLAGVAHVQAVALKAGILKTTTKTNQPGELTGVVLKGVGADYNWPPFRDALVAGKLPDFQTDTAGKGYSTQMVVSRFVANQLNLKPGSSVLLYFLGNQLRGRKMTVTGIYETGLEEVDRTIVVGDLRLIQRLNNWGADSVGSYELYVSDFAKLNQTYKTVMAQISPDMRLIRVTDQYRPLFDWMVLLDRNTSVFWVLILFVASFNMVSVLVVLMLERTPMIGLLKALGSPDALIRRLFLYVGLNMIGWGLLLGNVVGLGLCWLQDRFKLLPLDPKNYFMSYVPIEWDWTTIVGLNLATIGLIATVLWLPTLIINRIEPVKALVFKK